MKTEVPSTAQMLSCIPHTTCWDVSACVTVPRGCWSCSGNCSNGSLQDKSVTLAHSVAPVRSTCPCHFSPHLLITITSPNASESILVHSSVDSLSLRETPSIPLIILINYCFSMFESIATPAWLAHRQQAASNVMQT